jgi:polyphosphate kinase 2 (PPK2 family)
MRDQLNRCHQNAKPVLEHIAAFEQLWRVVGLVNNQEKVVKFWCSLNANIQQELYRKDLVPEA